jgi:hypothetical protein
VYLPAETPLAFALRAAFTLAAVGAYEVPSAKIDVTPAVVGLILSSIPSYSGTVNKA